MWTFLCLVVVLVCVVRSQESSKTISTILAGQYGTDVRLKCSIDSDRIMWREYITNMTHGVAVTKLQEDSEGVITVHAIKKDKFELEKDSLIIKKFSTYDIGSGSRMYTCQGGGVIQEFSITGIDKTKCTSPPAEVTEGSAVELSCQVEYSGNSVPQLRYRASGKQLPGKEYSDDLDDLFFGIKYRTKFNATADQDSKPVQCHVTVAGFSTDCSHTLNVLYTARDIKITPDPDMVYLGDNVNCSARGNPAPTLIWDPKPAKVTKGQGWVAFKVTEDMVKSTVTYSCMAYNEVRGEKTDLMKELSFQASVQTTPMPEPTTKPEAGDGPKTGGSTGEEEGANGAMVGAIIGVVVVLLIVIVIIVVLIQRRRKNRKETIEDETKKAPKERLNWQTRSSHQDETVKFKPETTNGKVPADEPSKEDKLLQIEESEKRNDEDMVDKV